MKKPFLFAPLAAAAILAAPHARAGDAAANWAKNCAACHGNNGAGHTKAGRMAGVKNMTDPVYQKTFADDAAAAQIKNGLTDKAGKVRMKAFGDVLSDADIKDLVAYVRSLQK